MNLRTMMLTTVGCTLWALAGASPVAAEATDVAATLAADGLQTMAAIDPRLDSGTVARAIEGRPSLVVTTRPSPALVRLERAVLRGRPIRALRIGRLDGGAAIELHDVTVSGWTYDPSGSDPTVRIQLTYERAD